MVNPEAYRWRVWYQDGSNLPEIEKVESDGGLDEIERSWLSVPIEQITSVEIISMIAGLPHVVIDIPPGATPSFRRRRSISISPDGLHPPYRDTTTIAGYGATWLWFYEDGSMRLRTTWRDEE